MVQKLLHSVYYVGWWGYFRAVKLVEIVKRVSEHLMFAHPLFCSGKKIASIFTKLKVPNSN